jgi:calcineurin-like phosphoesterase family protein
MKKPLKFGTNIYFTSDQHFGHENIIRFAERPFKDVVEMEKELIRRWNETVPNSAHVFILGDFSFIGRIEYIKDIVNELNGFKHLIFGNHDHQNGFTRDSVISLFDSAQDYLEIQVNDNEMETPQRIILSHYPMLTWNQKLNGSWQLFGHIHSGPNTIAAEAYLPLNMVQYDVGVDNNDYKPISYEEIKEIFTKRYLNGK